MSLPYSSRLVCLCLACFYLTHLAFGLIAAVVASAAARIAVRLRARAGARLLLALRLGPPGLAAFIVAGICIPSYLWLEPGDTMEDTGIVCLAAALLCACVWAVSSARATRALIRSRRFLEQCGRGEGEAAFWVVEERGPVVALAGMVAPRLIISGRVFRALSGEELAAVSRHEDAHRIAHDNWKRLAVLLAPGMIPFWNAFGPLEREWARLSEWAADDQAVSGDPRRAVALAAALVRVARLGTPPPLSPVTTSLMSDGRELEARVDRLLAQTAANATCGSRRSRGGITVGLLAVAALAVAAAQPATLAWAHRVLEDLVR